MTVARKLEEHLVHVVAPIGIVLTEKDIAELCLYADSAQRMAAIDRARVKTPFLLPDEETEALVWANKDHRRENVWKLRRLRYGNSGIAK